MPSKLNLEIKVGIFAFIGLIILSLAIFSISELYIFRPSYPIKVQFGFASGINIGAVVRVAGIEAGEVKDIDLTSDKEQGRAKIILSIWLKKDIKIPRDSLAYVTVLGLIGETYLEIVPGQDYEHLLEEGDVLVGRDSASSESLMEITHNVAANLEQVSTSINKILDEEAKADLKETIRNFRDFSHSLKIITGRLERGEGKLGAWLVPKKSRKKKTK